MSCIEHIIVAEIHPVSCAAQPAQVGENILLVEDERLVREVAGEVLTAAGYVVWKAGTAVEAIRIFKQYSASIGLLITDVVLPDDRGPDLSRKLQFLGGSFRTILISGYPEGAILKGSVNIPEFSYLPKPFSAGDLTRRVRLVLSAERNESVR